METGSGRTKSAWMDEVELQHTTPLDHDLTTGVCVIGAGVAGLSVAYRLAREGRDVIVIDDGPLGGGETSRTTAHLSNAIDDRYYVVERLHGERGARYAAESHTRAIDEIEHIADEEGIDCGFTRLDGYLFVPPGEALDTLARELEAAHEAGLTGVGWADRAPLAGFDTGRCLRFPRQGMFHPLRYLTGLVRAAIARGARIHTDTHATEIKGGKDGARACVKVAGGHTITAEHVVVATNTPINDLVTMHTKQFPYRTYAIAGRVPHGSVETALFWDTANPYHYVRLARDGDDDLLIVGGEDHKTGQEDDGTDRHYRLVSWARHRFPMMGDVVYRWSGQVLETMDAIAFIGRNPGDENVWIVTGDSGMGMTHGTIASILIPDLIAGRENPWARLYDPARKSLRAIGELARENLNMAAQYASWVTGGDVKDESEIARGAGAVMREGLHKVAVYRDETGRLHRCSAKCPHLGAIVSWNSEERTWDCPAHGSRFDAMGHVLNGPANTDLERPDAPESVNGKERATPEEEMAKTRVHSPGAQEKI